MQGHQDHKILTNVGAEVRGAGTILVPLLVVILTLEGVLLLRSPEER